MHTGGITAHPAGERTVQHARNLAPDLGDFRLLIRDRGSNFTAFFDAVIRAAGATIVRTAVQAPRMNATCERLTGTPHRELPDRTLTRNPGAPPRRPGRIPGALQHRPPPIRALASVSPALSPVPASPQPTLAPARSPENPVLSGLINEYERAT
jgi:hypothetical protein